MKQFVLYALLKAFVISVGVDLVLFFVELIECLWKNRKK